MTEINKDKRHEQFHKEVKEEEIKKQVEMQEKIKGLIGRITTSDDGIEFLKLLYSMSNFNSSIQGLSVAETLIFQKGKKETYERLRMFIPKEALIRIEIY